jgi:hypothetical protein
LGVVVTACDEDSKIQPLEFSRIMASSQNLGAHAIVGSRKIDVALRSIQFAKASHGDKSRIEAFEHFDR